MKFNNFNNLLHYTKTVLRSIYLNYSPTIFSCSLSLEDMVIIDLLFKEKILIDIFILDTNFLHLETLKMIKYIKKKYNYKILIIKPNIEDIEEYISKFGMYAFYKNSKLRKKCCYIRKIKPLKKILKGKVSWITGQRIQQSLLRSNIKVKEDDQVNNIIKFNPIIYWSDKNIWKYITINKIFYNILYNKGYKSIGCKPCTRSVLKNEEIRFGRWWWEKNSLKECGIHLINIKKNN